MYKHILVPTDGSELSSAAVDQALQLAGALGARLTALTVAEPLHFMPVTPGTAQTVRAEYEAHIKEESLRILGSVQAKAIAAGITIETVQIAAGDAWQAIVDTAKERDCDLIFMASHGRRGVSAFLMGSVTTKVSAIPPFRCSSTGPEGLLKAPPVGFPTEPEVSPCGRRRWQASRSGAPALRRRHRRPANCYRRRSRSSARCRSSSRAAAAPSRR